MPINEEEGLHAFPVQPANEAAAEAADQPVADQQLPANEAAYQHAPGLSGQTSDPWRMTPDEHTMLHEAEQAPALSKGFMLLQVIDQPEAGPGEFIALLPATIMGVIQLRTCCQVLLPGGAELYTLSTGEEIINARWQYLRLMQGLEGKAPAVMPDLLPLTEACVDRFLDSLPSLP
jgi:hypothetical protein